MSADEREKGCPPESVVVDETEAASKDDGSPRVTLVAKWGKEKIELSELQPSTTISQVKEMLSERTGVLCKRQKLIGLSVASGPKSGLTDDIELSMLKPPKKSSAVVGSVTTHQFILMGTAEQKIFVDPCLKEDLPEVVDDFDLDFNAGSEQWVHHVANNQNLKKFTEATEIHFMNAPRPGKPCLVLDLDHTLLDFSSKALLRDSQHGAVGTGLAISMKRPHMDEFLTAAYSHYDLVVWSQTSWRWLETKLIELGMVTHPGYKFCFVLDKSSMFAITSTKRDGSSKRHHVKPLQIIWTKYPNWGSHNTVHVDDLQRNFALNQGSGLRVSGFYRKKARGDNELVALSRYLVMLASSGLSFDDVDFTYWMDVASEKRPLVKKDDRNKK